MGQNADAPVIGCLAASHFTNSLVRPADKLCTKHRPPFFSEDGVLRLEFDELYHALFSNADLYIEVVKLLCEHKTGATYKEISKAIKLEGGKLRRVLLNLERCDFIEKWAQYGNKRRETRYRMVDFYTMFYYEFIEPNSFEEGHWWSNNIDSRNISSWMGNAFEQVCMTHHRQIKEKLHIDSMATSVSSWHKKSDEELPGAQIDMIIERADRIIHLCGNEIQ